MGCCVTSNYVPGISKGLVLLFFSSFYQLYWHKIGTFKAYSLLIWYTYIWQSDYYYRTLPSCHIITISLVCVVRTFKVYSFSNFRVYNAVWLTTITMLYLRISQMKIHIIWPTSHFPSYPGPGNHHCGLCVWV